MQNKIDQFFKDKLEEHLLSPSEEAWARVEVSLSKKNNVAVWRIAAAILITGALISVIIWSQHDNKNRDQILAIKKSPKDNSTIEKPAVQISQIKKKTNSNSTPKSVSTLTAKKSSEPKSEPLPRFVPPQTESKTDQKESNENKTLSVKTQKTVGTEEQTVAIVQENIKEEKIISKATPLTTIASTKQKPIKLEFTLEGFSTEQPVATASEEKSSGLKKVWDLAREVKNGDGPVHEMKNELFALSFKKSKNQ